MTDVFSCLSSQLSSKFSFRIVVLLCRQDTFFVHTGGSRFINTECFLLNLLTFKFPEQISIAEIGVQFCIEL